MFKVTPPIVAAAVGWLNVLPVMLPLMADSSSRVKAPLARRRAAQTSLLGSGDRAVQAPSDDALGADDPLAFQVLNEIGIIEQLASHRADRLLAPALNLPQFTVLNHFARLGGERSLSQLAVNMQVTKGAMTNTVARLAAKGLLAVKPDPNDGRGKLVSLTANGQLARDKAVGQFSAGLASVAQAVSAQELAELMPVLRKLREWFDRNR